MIYKYLTRSIVSVLVCVSCGGCKPNPKKILTPTPGSTIVVDKDGNESEMSPLSNEEFKKLQNDLQKQRRPKP